MKFEIGLRATVGIICCLCYLDTSWADSNSSTITVQVQVSVAKTVDIGVMAVGFAVGDSSKGSLGRVTTKTGPLGATYEFGFRTTSGMKVSCGSTKLLQDTLVLLYYNGKSCGIKNTYRLKQS